MDISKIISLDESGFNNVSLTGMGLAPIGKRINMPISGKKTINHSLICALTTEGIIHYEIRTGSVNGDIFKKFTTMKKNNDKSKLYEYNFSIKYINSNTSKQWSSKFGEKLVKFLLEKQNYKVKEQSAHDGKKIDLETDIALYEIKTRNY